MAKQPYHDAAWLREHYHDKGMTLKEMGDTCGVSGTTIGEWMDRHDIDRRTQQEAQKPDKPYTDKAWLQNEYVENERSTHDIGDECGVSGTAILKWLRRFDIPTRSKTDHIKRQRVTFVELPRGYRRVLTKVAGEVKYAYVHQLVAIAKGADPEKVFSGEYHVHHTNGVKWDNRPGNIEFLDASAHAQEHSSQRVRTATGEWE